MRDVYMYINRIHKVAYALCLIFLATYFLLGPFYEIRLPALEEFT
jgi:hypothetical protein